MKVLIIYSSIHHGNTEKVAKVMAKALNADLVKSGDIKDMVFEKYDLIGFGSGIFNGKYHEKLYQVIEKASLRGKEVFAFSTSGIGRREYNKPFIEQLETSGAVIKGDFSCKGYDTYGILKWIGGISKRHPNNNDLENAQNFAKGLLR